MSLIVVARLGKILQLRGIYIDSEKFNSKTMFEFAVGGDSKLLAPAIALLCVALVATPINTLMYGEVFGALADFVAGSIERKAFLNTVWSKVSIIFIVGAAKMVCTWFAAILYMKFGERVLIRARSRVYYDGLLTVPMTKLDGQTELMGKLAQLNRSFEEVRQGHSDAIAVGVESLAMVIGLFVTAMTRAWLLTLVVMVLAPVMAFLTWFFGRVIMRNQAAENKYTQAASKVVDWCLGNGKVFVRLFNGNEIERNKFTSLVAESQKAYVRMAMAMSANGGVVKTLIFMAFVQGFWFGISMISKGHLTVSQVFTCFSACLMAGSLMSMLAAVIPIFNKAAVAEKVIVSFSHEMGLSDSAREKDGTVPPSPTSYALRDETIVDEYAIAEKFSYIDLLEKPVPKPLLSFNRINFHYPARPLDPVLLNVSLEFGSGFNFVVGSLGSGKLTLALLVLGIYSPISGMIRRPPLSDITYVEQFPTIFPGMLLFDNVALSVVGTKFRKLSDVPNSAVVSACRFAELTEVVLGLTDHYDTILDANLLGGQQQRILIARAYLRDTPVLILDEAMSALDKATKSVIMDKLRKWRTGSEYTTIIITHEYGFTRPEDRVFTLEKGQVVENKLLTKTEEDSEATKMVAHHQLEGSEQIADGKLPLMLLWPIICWYFRESPKPFLLWLGVFALVGCGITTPIFSFFFSKLLQMMLSGSGNLAQMSGALIGIAIATGVSQFTSQFLLLSTSESWIVGIRNSVVENLLLQPIDYIKDNRVAETTALSMNDTRDLRLLTSDFIMVVSTVAVMLIGGLTWALVAGWKLALVGVAFVPLIGLITGVYSATMGRLESRYKGLISNLENHGRSTVSGLKTVKVYGCELLFARRWENVVSDVYQVGTRRAIALGFGVSINNLLVAFAQGTLLYYGAKLIADQAYSSGQMLEVITLLTMSLTGAMGYMLKIPSIARGKRAATYLRQHSELEPSALENEGDIIPSLKNPVIQFKLVSFSYDNLLILHDVDFSVREGEFVAITGPLGLGKLTIASLINRLYGATSGEVEVFGESVHLWDKSALHSTIATVSQLPTFFEGTILENVCGYATTAPTEDDIWSVLEEVGMGLVVRELADGLHTRMGEGLSTSLFLGGQLQRLAFARALLRRLKILLLDECTLALDPESASKIIELMKSLTTTRTVLAITHDPAVISAAPRVLAVNGGYVYEE